MDTEPRQARLTALLVLAEHWTCVALCAELLERNLGAECAPSLAVAVLRAVDPHPDMPAVGVFVIEQEALLERDRQVLAWAAGLGEPPAWLVIAPAGAKLSKGPWSGDLRRPIQIGQLAKIIEQQLDAVEAGSSAPRSRARPERDLHLSVRRGAPWPIVACPRCGASRHCETPRTPGEACRTGAEFMKFAFEHWPCQRA